MTVIVMHAFRTFVDLLDSDDSELQRAIEQSLLDLRCFDTWVLCLCVCMSVTTLAG